jgi:hypothetical protein
MDIALPLETSSYDMSADPLSIPGSVCESTYTVDSDPFDDLGIELGLDDGLGPNWCGTQFTDIPPVSGQWFIDVPVDWTGLFDVLSGLLGGATDPLDDIELEL